MLKTIVPNNDIIVRTDIFSEDFSSDRDFYNSRLLNFSVNGVINGVVDSEIYEYKPESMDVLNFNLFFLRYIQDSEYDQLKDYLETGFQTQYYTTKLKFGLIDDIGNTLTQPLNNLFETRQANGLRETPVLFDRALTKSEALKQKPYFLPDTIGATQLKTPSQSGIPIFYNSFTIPYWDSKDKWINEELLYTNKPYFFNSFLLLEFYDSPLPVSQNRIQSIPIFVNRRYNITEKNIRNDFHYERPCFKLTNGVDGYSFFFLRNYRTNEFYVRYSFWDALNGKKIPLIPSSDVNPGKKWLQNPDTFNQNSRYLKYVLDYDNKTYNILEYNTSTSQFDTERTNFDLYELAFDSYYVNNIVSNEIPINSKTIPPQRRAVNPLTFTIKNLYTNNYVGNSSKKYKQLTEGEINKAETFANNNTKNFIRTFNTYIENLNTDIFGSFPKTEYVMPVVNTKISGHQILLKPFVFKNNDTVTWNIRSIEFKDISVLVNGVNINNTLYNQKQSLWNEKDKFRVSEAITVLSGIGGTFQASYDTVKFTEDVVYTYLADPSVFKKLLDAIQLERYQYYYVYNLQSKNIALFLDECFKVLNVKYNQSHKKTTNYTGFAYNPNTKKIDNTKSEIHYYINELVENYGRLKANDLIKFNSLRTSIISLLKIYKPIDTLYDISSVLVNHINKILSPKDNEELLNKYILLVLTNNLSFTDKKIINQDINIDTLPLLLDKPVSELGYEPRDYTLDTFVVQYGDKTLIPGETNKIDLYFNIGEKIKYIVENSNEIRITGNLRISVINNSGEIKNIVIPLKSSIKPGNQSKNPSTKVIPEYTVSDQDPDSKINILSLLK